MRVTRHTLTRLAGSDPAYWLPNFLAAGWLVPMHLSRPADATAHPLSVSRLPAVSVFADWGDQPEDLVAGLYLDHATGRPVAGWCEVVVRLGCTPASRP